MADKKSAELKIVFLSFGQLNRAQVSPCLKEGRQVVDWIDITQEGWFKAVTEWRIKVPEVKFVCDNLSVKNAVEPSLNDCEVYSSGRHAPPVEMVMVFDKGVPVRTSCSGSGSQWMLSKVDGHYCITEECFNRIIEGSRSQGGSITTLKFKSDDGLVVATAVVATATSYNRLMEDLESYLPMSRS